MSRSLSFEFSELDLTWLRHSWPSPDFHLTFTWPGPGPELDNKTYRYRLTENSRNSKCSQTRFIKEELATLEIISRFPSKSWPVAPNLIFYLWQQHNNAYPTSPSPQVENLLFEFQNGLGRLLFMLMKILVQCAEKYYILEKWTELKDWRNFLSLCNKRNIFHTFFFNTLKPPVWISLGK